MWLLSLNLGPKTNLRSFIITKIHFIYIVELSWSHLILFRSRNVFLYFWDLVLGIVLLALHRIECRRPAQNTRVTYSIIVFLEVLVCTLSIFILVSDHTAVEHIIVESLRLLMRVQSNDLQVISSPRRTTHRSIINNALCAFH